MRLTFVASLFVLLSLSACGDPSTDRPSAKSPLPADTIYSGGPIITMHDAMPTVAALAVRDGIIVAVGDAEDVAVYRDEETVDVDLTGRTLSPGFIDGHAHIAQFGMQAVGANLLASPDGRVENIEQLIDELKRFCRQ